MRILYMTDQEGGAYNHMKSIETPAKALGHDTAVLDAREIQPPNYSLYGLGMKLKDFEDTLDEFNPDIVHIFNFCLWGESVFETLDSMGIPAILYMTDYALICKTRMFFKGPFTEICNAASMKHDCDGCRDMCLSITTPRKEMVDKFHYLRIMVGSSFFKNLFVDYGYDRDKIDVVELGINPDDYEFSDSFGSDTVLNFNRMAYEKGYDIYSKLASENGKHRWLLAGAPALDDRVVSALPGVEYIGSLNETEKREALRGCDVFCSTPRWHEPIGITYLEAKACGRPVVTFDMGGLGQYHGEEGCGSKVFNYGDLDGMSEYIDEILADENELRKMGKEARHQIETRQNQNVVINDVIRIYEEELGKR